MKNVFVSVLAILTSVSAYSSMPKSIGKDLLCVGDATITTPYYTCETGYGMNDFCRDEERRLSFGMNAIKGDLKHSLSGPIFITEIDLEGPAPLQTFTANELAMGKLLKAIVKKTHGTISYENKVATLKVQTVLGNEESTESVDFSKGAQQDNILVRSGGTIDDPLKKYSHLNVSIDVMCRPQDNL